MINHFSVLGVRANAKEDDIKKAYKRLSNKYHPDKLLGASDDEKQQASV
ncbi:MAG: DnaJ-class molecular chaperone, partial [Shewanella sp.]